MTDFERVKDALNLLDVITQESGFQMKGPHLAECPFCGGHNCFSIKDQTWHCFQCNRGGDVFNFLAEFHNLDEYGALKLAAELAHVELEHKSDTPKKEKAESDQERMYRLALKHYREAIAAADSPARKYFIERGHTIETLETMQVGCATGQLTAFLKEQGFKEEDIVKYGLARNKDREGKDTAAYDYFAKGLAIFPVIDSAGVVKSFTAKDPAKKIKATQMAGQQKTWMLHQAVIGHSESFIVEGENDIGSLIDIGIPHTLGTAGQPGQEQIKLLRNFYSGKKIYLWYDQDKQRAFRTDRVKGHGGPSHIRFIYEGLKESEVDVRIIIHPGDAKDPDEFIQGLRKSGRSISEIRATIRELKLEALTPLEWEIEQLTFIPEAKDRLEAFKLRKLPQAINWITSSADQEIAIEQAAKAIGIKITSVEEIVNNAVDLYSSLQERYSGDLKKADAYQLSQQIYNWFSNGAGGKFYKTSDGKVWLFYQRRTFEIGNNLDFNTLMLQLTRLAAIDKPGSMVWYYLANFCNMQGELVDMMSWQYTDREKDTIYLNVNSSHNKIMRLAPGEEPHLIDNGTNEHSILLSKSPQIRHFEYTTNTGEAEGFAALKSLLMDTTPCEGPQRYFLLCWFISIFMMTFQSDRGLLQIIATSRCGKSKVAERLSQLLYGENFVGRGTGAAETRVATSNPLLFLDNVENRNLLNATVDFLLVLANSNQKPKAKAGSDTEVLYQKLDAMAIITSIEAFPGRLPELVNRTFPLMLEPAYKQHGYMHDEVMRAILKKRNVMLSSILRMLAMDVLPNLGSRLDWSKHLQTNYPSHAKDRNNEHICTMMLILEALLKHIPWKKDIPIKKAAADILDHWIRYQQEQEHVTAITSNTLLTHMDGLAREMYRHFKSKGIKRENFQSHPEFDAPYPGYFVADAHKDGVQVMITEDGEYLESFYLTEEIEELSEESDQFTERVRRLEFIVTSADLYVMLNRYCKNQGTRNPFENPTSLGSRIGNDKHVMEQAGWTYVSKTPNQAQYKKIQGKWHWRFSKRILVDA